jgi:hypothetical protein
MRHLGIRPSGNSPSQKVSPIYEGVCSIPWIFKIYVCVCVCVSLDYNFYHIKKIKKSKKYYPIQKLIDTDTYFNSYF